MPADTVINIQSEIPFLILVSHDINYVLFKKINKERKKPQYTQPQEKKHFFFLQVIDFIFFKKSLLCN